jgi:hypothetical protein
VVGGGEAFAGWGFRVGEQEFGGKQGIRNCVSQNLGFDGGTYLGLSGTSW